MQKGLSEMLNMLSPDISNLEDFLVLLRDLPNNVIVKEQGHLEAIHSIHVVGFHHKQGSIVEFSYPTTVKSDLLPYLSLPDCVHNETVK